MTNDIAIGPVSGFGNVAISKKPSYLIILEGTTSKVIKKFITLDKPVNIPGGGFVEVKGFYTELPEEEIIKSLSEVLTSTSKDLILEVLLPWHKICSMRSLVFKQK